MSHVKRQRAMRQRCAKHSDQPSMAFIVAWAADLDGFSDVADAAEGQLLRGMAGKILCGEPEWHAFDGQDAFDALDRLDRSRKFHGAFAEINEEYVREKLRDDGGVLVVVTVLATL